MLWEALGIEPACFRPTLDPEIGTELVFHPGPVSSTAVMWWEALALEKQGLSSSSGSASS